MSVHLALKDWKVGAQGTQIGHPAATPDLEWPMPKGVAGNGTNAGCRNIQPVAVHAGRGAQTDYTIAIVCVVTNGVEL